MKKLINNPADYVDEALAGMSLAHPGAHRISGSNGRVDGASTGEQTSQAAQIASAEALQEFRNSPAMIGRLRLAPSRGIGSDDPGMIALDVAVSALAASPLARVTTDVGT